MNEEHKAVKELRLSVRALVRAELDYAFMGTTHPDEHEGIERRLRKAGQRYSNALDFIEHIIGEEP